MNTNQHTSAKGLNYFISVKLQIRGTNVPNARARGLAECPGGRGVLPYKKGGDARREISNEPLKGTQSGCGLSGILPLKDTNQKHRDKQLV